MWSQYCLLLLVGAVQATTGQAPGDADDVCLEYSAHQKNHREMVLLNNFHYRYLLKPRGPWTVIDSPRPNLAWKEYYLISWRPICNSLVVTCEWRCPQENWLITQFINNTMRKTEIYIRAKYVMLARSCLAPAPPTVDVYVLQTNQSNISFTGNISSIFVTPPVGTLTRNSDYSSWTRRIVTIRADLSTTGFYIAFKDCGVCLHLRELTVFYPVCDAAISLDIGANFSEMGLPGDTSTGVCFANMAISLNPLEDRFNATCMVTAFVSSKFTDRLITNWTINDHHTSQQCICRPGYEFTNRTTMSQCRELDCASAAADTLRKQLHTLTDLNYNAMRIWLLAKSVITNAERRIIDRKVGINKMKYLITEIIIPSLNLNSCTKFKALLEAMESSDDGNIRNAAKRFGGSKSVQKS